MVLKTEKTDVVTSKIDHYDKLIVSQSVPRKYEIVIGSAIVFSYFHVAALYGLYLSFTSAYRQTVVLGCVLYIAAVIGATAGAHRLWSHKAYKAKLPLQIILMILHSISNQFTATNWARDHRMHHKFTDTDADPHNATRGFFFSHIGWLLVKKHPEVKKRGKLIDMSDIYNNPVLRFQKTEDNSLSKVTFCMTINKAQGKTIDRLVVCLPEPVFSQKLNLRVDTQPILFGKRYYENYIRYAFLLLSTLAFIFPTVIPILLWNENFNNAWHINMLRFVLNMHAAFTVNSIAHMWGYKTYDKNMLASQNLAASVVTLGEGFHNYHNTFPWDYRTAELGNSTLSFATIFIDFFAWIGWAYDLKTTPKNIIRARAARTGDGTNLWGRINKT